MKTVNENQASKEWIELIPYYSFSKTSIFCILFTFCFINENGKDSIKIESPFKFFK